MSIARRAMVSSWVPRINRFPVGAGLFWSLHGSLVGYPGTPTLQEVEFGTGAAAGALTDDEMMYSFPENNYESGNGVLLLAEHSADDDSLEQVLGLIGAEVGTQVLIAMTVLWGDQQGGNGHFWCYGLQTANASFYSPYFTTSEAPGFAYRGKDASAQTLLTVGGGLTAGSGTALTDAAWRANDVRFVTSLTVTSSDTVDLAMYFGDGTRSISYTGTCTWSTNGGTAPGRGTSPTATHPGLYIGGRAQGGPAPDNLLGRGAGHSARVGTVCARRFTSYSAGRELQAITDLLDRPDDYPESWLVEEA